MMRKVMAFWKTAFWIMKAGDLVAVGSVIDGARAWPIRYMTPITAYPVLMDMGMKKNTMKSMQMSMKVKRVMKKKRKTSPSASNPGAWKANWSALSHLAALSS